MCSAAKENSKFLSVPDDVPQVLIIGCGYVGRELLARYQASGWVVTATTRSGRLASDHGEWVCGSEKSGAVRCLALDLCAPASLAAFRAALDGDAFDAVHVLVPPGPEPERVLLEGPTRLLGIPAIATARRILLASSTAVYGDRAGAWVSADMPARADDERGQRLLAAEQAWLTHPAVRVVRLAGLYGPGRLIGAGDLRSGRPLFGDPERWLNLIHVADAATLLVAVAAAEGAARIELGSDDAPVQRRDWYAGLAAALGLPPPRFDGLTRADGPRAASAASRRCDNGPTCRRTGWRPRYPDWQSGLAASIRGSGSGSGSGSGTAAEAGMASRD